VSGATPFYCPVKLRFCVRSNSCIVVRFRPIFAIIPLKSFLESKIVQNITREKAIELFDEELFDVVKYAISKGIVVDDSYV